MTANSKRRNTQGKVRIFFLIHSLGFGGAERVVVDFAKNLDPDHYKADICTLSESQSLAGELCGSRVGLHVLRKRRRFDLALLLELTNLMRGLRPDVLSMHCRDALHFGTLASLFARVPVRIATEHSVGPGVNRALNRVAYRLSFSTWTSTVAVSDYLKDFMARTWSLPSRRIHVIHNGIDFSRFPASPDRQRLRRELCIPDGVRVIGNVGTLKREKGHKEFLEVAAKILAAGVNAHFVIIGGGILLDELVRYASCLGIAGRTHFLGARPDVPELVAGFDVFLCTSEVETFGLAIVEAMYMGVPVVAFDVGSIREIVIEGTNGFVVPPGDHAAASARVISLLTSQDERERMGLSARTTAVERFSADRMIQSYEKLFFKQH